jgi:hypothetical protein
MGSYSQWRKSGGGRRLTWVCGTEIVLINEVIEHTRGLVDDAAWFTAGDDSERDIWAAAFQPLLGTATRLVMVSRAGHLRRWDMLERWLAAAPRELPGMWLLLADDRPDFPRQDGKLAVPATYIRDSRLGQLVKCSPLADEDLIEWARVQIPAASRAAVVHLADRTGGDLTAIASLAAKARRAGATSLRPEHIDMLCAEQAGDEFAGELLAQRKSKALLAASQMHPSELGRAIALLVSRLDTVVTLRAAKAADASRRDMTVKYGVPAFLAARLLPLTASYPPAVARRRREALALADSEFRRGAREGLAEALTALW